MPGEVIRIEPDWNVKTLVEESDKRESILE